MSAMGFYSWLWAAHFFSSVVDEDTEGMFVSFVDGPEVGGIAYLVDKSRFKIIHSEGPNFKKEIR